MLNFGEDWSSSFGGEQANKWKLRSRGSAYFVKYLRMYWTDFCNLYVQMMDRYLIVRFLKGRCHGNQIICERQVRHGPKKLAYF